MRIRSPMTGPTTLAVSAGVISAETISGDDRST
jgi:hypothetical protein